jgi:hypothetical protein
MKNENLKMVIGGILTGVTLAGIFYVFGHFISPAPHEESYYKPAEWKKLVAEKENPVRPAYFEELKMAPSPGGVEIRGPASAKKTKSNN